MPTAPGTNGRDWTSLKAWANAIGVVGIPGAIAFFLIYVGATTLPQVIAKLDSLIAETKHSQVLQQEHNVQTEILIRVMQRTCRSAAKAAKDSYAYEHCDDK